MVLDVRGINVDVGGSLSEYAERRLNSALDRFTHRVRRVGVRLTDLNGPKGGASMQCRVIVHLEHAEPVVIEQVEHDLYTAVDRAATRTKRTVRRHINRRRDAHRAAAHHAHAM